MFRSRRSLQGFMLALTLLLAGCKKAPLESPAENQRTIPQLGAHVFGENTIADVASRSVNSVVNIDTRTAVTIPDSDFGFAAPESFFDHSMVPNSPRTIEKRGTGSGVIIREDGYILTNNHVVGEADEIKVTLHDKRVLSGKVIGKDKLTDLAVVRVDATKLPAAKLGASKTLRPGDWVMAIGSPAGLSETVTLGIISAVGRSLEELDPNMQFLQTDAAINPGNSGGPLINIEGEVVGINTAVRANVQNIGFSIPIDVAKDISAEIIKRGAVRRAYLGIAMLDLSPRVNAEVGLPLDSKGVLVAQLREDGPAGKAGLAVGDVIISIDGQPISNAKQVQQFVRSKKSGDKIAVEIRRSQKLLTRTIPIGSM